MVLKAGRMNIPVRIEAPATTQDAMGQLVKAPWTLVGTRMASIEPLNGREYFAASGEGSDVNVRIRLRYDNTLRTVDTTHRLLDQRYSPMTTYDIEAVINENQRNREIILMCRRG